MIGVALKGTTGQTVTNRQVTQPIQKTSISNENTEQQV